MSQENINYMVSNKNIKPKEVVSIPVSLFKSIREKYFAGQTETLEDGKFIEPPNGNYVIVIKSSSSKLHKVIVAFGWWENQYAKKELLLTSSIYPFYYSSISLNIPALHKLRITQ